MYIEVLQEAFDFDARETIENSGGRRRPPQLMKYVVLPERCKLLGLQTHLVMRGLSHASNAHRERLADNMGHL